MSEIEKVLDWDAMEASMIAETGFDAEMVEAYLDAEEQYLVEKGIILWPGVNCTQEELDAYLAVPEQQRTPADIDIDDMVDFIVRSTKMSFEKVNAMVDAEYNYEHRVGMAGDITVEYVEA